MSVRKKRSGRPRGEPRVRPYAEFTVDSVDIVEQRVPSIAWFNGCATMTTKPRWWRCVATVYGELADGRITVAQIAMDSDEKALISEVIESINARVDVAMADAKIVVFIRAECRCIILEQKPIPKSSKGEQPCL